LCDSIIRIRIDRDVGPDSCALRVAVLKSILIRNYEILSLSLSLPMRERGLKRMEGRPRHLRWPRRSPAGAWIETTKTTSIRKWATASLPPQDRRLKLRVPRKHDNRHSSRCSRGGAESVPPAVILPIPVVAPFHATNGSTRSAISSRTLQSKHLARRSATPHEQDRGVLQRPASPHTLNGSSARAASLLPIV
jgi:hypothetical protein